jgi:hypothetical protein
MSRSYKKYPIVKDHNKGAKQLANKKVRRFLKNFELLIKGTWYKRIFNQYDITDWIYFPWDEESKIKFKRK